jgi:hypothetical protein
MHNPGLRRQVKRASAGLVRSVPIAVVSLLGWGVAPNAYASGFTVGGSSLCQECDELRLGVP